MSRMTQHYRAPGSARLLFWTRRRGVARTVARNNGFVIRTGLDKTHATATNIDVFVVVD